MSCHIANDQRWTPLSLEICGVPLDRVLSYGLFMDGGPSVYLSMTINVQPGSKHDRSRVAASCK